MAENKEGQEKTEQATAKRIQEARLRGQVSKSTDVTTSAMLLFGTLIVLAFGSYLSGNLQNYLKESFSQIGYLTITTDNVKLFYVDTLVFLAKILLPILILIFIVVFASEVSQVGFLIATKKFTEGLNWQIVFNPLNGLKRIFFSVRSLFEFGKSVFKMLVIGIVVYNVIKNRTEEALSLIDKPYTEIGAFLVDISVELVLKVAVVYIIIAVADYFFQKYRYKEDLKMTKQEVKEEYKQAEGDPKIKARLRSIMRQRVRKIMLQNVRKADVVITNPTHYAVALLYKQGEMNAPKVVAKGVDFLAEKIKEIAREEDIPIVEEPPLARALYYSVEIDQEIPEKFFKAVAQILAYIYYIKKKVMNF